MFKNLEARLILSDISKKELAQKMGIGYNTLLCKFRTGYFTLDEAILIKKITNAAEGIEELFKNSQETKTA